MEREARIMLAGLPVPRAVGAYFSCGRNFAHSPDATVQPSELISG